MPAPIGRPTMSESVPAYPVVEFPAAVAELVERFDRNRTNYESAAYNETTLRREFLDPFFRGLGWDVDNSTGIPEAYKDVVHEDRLEARALRAGPTSAPTGSRRGLDQPAREGGDASLIFRRWCLTWVDRFRSRCPLRTNAYFLSPCLPVNGTLLNRRMPGMSARLLT